MSTADDVVKYVCEWCQPSDTPEEQPEICKVLYCCKHRTKTWHYPKEDEMYHEADIGIRLDNAGLFAALELAGQRGDLDGFKRALQQSYGPAASRVFNKITNEHYSYILSQAEKLMDATSEKDQASLVFWATLAEYHEKREEVLNKFSS